MPNELLAKVSAQDVSDAQTEHYRLDNDINREVSRLSLDQKREVLKNVRDIVSKMTAE